MLSFTGTSIMVRGSSVTLSLRHLWQVCLTRKVVVTISAKKEDLPSFKLIEERKSNLSEDVWLTWFYLPSLSKNMRAVP